MIRHIVLFKLKPGVGWDDPRIPAAEEMSRNVGREVPCLREWYVGRNFSTRSVAYDYVVIGLVDDEAALEEYMTAPFHARSVELWREISDWIVADVFEAPLGHDADDEGLPRLRLGVPDPAAKAVV